MTRNTRRKLPVYPTLADVHRMLAACESERDRLLVELLWYTGGRVSEVLRVRVGDITEHGVRMVNLKQGEPAEKHVFLPPRFVDRLRRAVAGRRPDELVVTHLRGGRALSRKRAWEIVTAAGRRAGVLKRRAGAAESRPPWPHAFRHGNAINLLEQNVPVSAVQAQLGHSSLASTQVYLEITDPHRERMIAGVRF